MSHLRRLTALLLTFLLTLPLALCPVWADAPATQVTILFTHDMHSHFLPAPNGQGGTYGGFARLKTAIDRQKALHPDALLVDGGDFSMGSLFQTGYADSALELRTMGAMGYDVTTFGNHEYDYRPKGLASMLNAALDSGDPLPAIVEANYLPPTEGQEGYDDDIQAVWDAFERYGVTDYVLLEKGGVWFAVVGINGLDSDACAPMSGMILHDRFEAAQKAVDAAKKECQDQNGVQPLVVCLSHSGTDGKGKGEDYELAQKVKGIDLIVPGHTHTTLPEPIQVGSTCIVSCGEYSKNLGVVTFDYRPDGTGALAGYELIPIGDELAEDPAIAGRVQAAKAEVEQGYLASFGGLTFDQVLLKNSYTFDTVDDTYASHHESTLGNILSDAYLWASEQATGLQADVALTAAGVIRETVPVGDVTVYDVFNIASLGIGEDGVPGYPLIAVYLTGKELKTALEVDTSVSELMSAARLYFSGVEYTYNTSRMLFNRVTECAIRRSDGTTEPIEDNKLYRVITGLYCGQMLGEVKRLSRGLLSIEPKDANGTLIDMDHLEGCILHDADGSEVKEWYSVASYLMSMGGQMDEQYGRTDGRKVVYASWLPTELLKNANAFTWVALGVIVLLLFLIIFILRCIFSRLSPHGRKRSARGYSPYKGK